MLIRSQDKRTVIVLENKSSLFVEKFQNYPYGKLLGELSFIQAGNKIIGIYVTEERAIEVLDEICNAYLNLNIAKGSEFFGMNSSMGYFGGYVKNGVFQMPEV